MRRAVAKSAAPAIAMKRVMAAAILTVSAKALSAAASGLFMLPSVLPQREVSFHKRRYRA
jgi:hypothetical protein